MISPISDLGQSVQVRVNSIRYRNGAWWPLDERFRGLEALSRRDVALFPSVLFSTSQTDKILA